METRSLVLKEIEKKEKERAFICETLIEFEGCSSKVYRCTSNYLTIGVGCNVETNGLCPEAIAVQLLHDINKSYEQAKQLFSVAEWNALNDARKDALMMMVFQIGINGVSKFTKTLGLIKLQKFEAAAENMLISKWARQTKSRARKMADLMRTGKHE